MLEIKVGIQLTSLNQPFKKALHTAARLGAQGVEISARHHIRPGELSRTAIRQIRKMLDDLNMRICAVSFRTRRGYQVAEDLDQRIEATKRAMTMAYELGAPVVVNQVGRVPDDEGPDWDRLVQSLEDLGRYGQHVGAVLAAETGTESGENLAKLLETVENGMIAVNFDPGNLIINDFSPSESLKALGKYVMHVHAKDGVRDLAQGRGIEVPLGRGSAEFPLLMAQLEEHQYRGYFTIERENSEDPIFEIGQAVQYLRNV